MSFSSCHQTTPCCLYYTNFRQYNSTLERLKINLGC
nr:MAG TPA: hypothetical protein [Caudoviricetes sp.]